MAVTVTVGQGAVTDNDRQHEKGKSFVVSQTGHLFVSDNLDPDLGHTLAVYAPTSWASAVVTEEDSS